MKGTGLLWARRDASWLKDAIASSSKSGRGTPHTKQGSRNAPGSDPGANQQRRSTGRDSESDEEMQGQTNRASAMESRRTRGGRVASAAIAAAAVAAADASAPAAGAGSPDILKPVDNDEREHLDPYIAKLQKRQRQQQRCDS